MESTVISTSNSKLKKLVKEKKNTKSNDFYNEIQKQI